MTDIRKYVNIINEALQKEDKSHPDKYFKGVSNKEKTKRKKDFEKNAKKDDDDPSAYEPMTGDDEKTTTKSKYTNKYKEQFNESKTALKNKSEETGIPYSILKKVYDRGMSAWRTGHRPGTTPHQWALARVNSFAVGGKTRQTADKDLWDEYKGKKKKTNESVGKKLGDLISISTGKDDADLYVTRRGSLESVGKPTKEYNKEAYGITIKDRELLDTQYLYYMLMYVHSSGYFKSKAKGTTNLVNITKDDILNIPVK